MPGNGRRNGGIAIKRIWLALTAFLVIILTAGCGTTNTSSSGEQTSISTEVTGSTSVKAPESTVPAEDSEPIKGAQEATTPESTGKTADGPKAGKGEELLQSASVDLNGDGESEQVEVLQILPGESGASTDEIEGILRIKSRTGDVQLSFWKKAAGMAGILSGIRFEDLDRDGAKDVFITIPDNGAAFAYSNYYMYSYKKNRSYSFTSDNELGDFINGFQFQYHSGNKLTLENANYSFDANITIGSGLNQQPTQEDMEEYVQKAWIEPVSVDISENSKLALIKGADGTPEIKVPLPIFGFATVDMIGEIDMYFSVDNTLHPVLKRFDVLDFNGTELVKAGSCKVTQ